MVFEQSWWGIVPSGPRAWIKSQSRHVIGPPVGPKEESQQIDRLRHRQAKTSPKKGIAKQRHRPRNASPSKDIAQEGHRQAKTSPKKNSRQKKTSPR